MSGMENALFIFLNNQIYMTKKVIDLSLDDLHKIEIQNINDRLDLRYPTPPVCTCNIRADIRVVLFEKKKTKGLLYYSCSKNQCE